MKVAIDRDKCCGAGMCVLNAPDIFTQDEDDGLVVLLMSEPKDMLQDAARSAANLCPAQVIEVIE